MIHFHQWKDKVKGFGLLPKNNVPEETGMNGYAKQCDKCGKYFFFPDNPKLRKVEMDEPKAMKP